MPTLREAYALLALLQGWEQCHTIPWAVTMQGSAIAKVIGHQVLLKDDASTQ